MAINVTLKDTSGNEEKILYPQTTWGIIANKPSWLITAENNGSITINYPDLIYNRATASVSGAVTVNGATPLHFLTATGNISSIKFATGVPEDNHSCHLIITAEGDYTATLSHGSTVAISGTTYTFKCPEASDISLTIKANGYVELDLLRIGTNIYVRGI